MCLKINLKEPTQNSRVPLAVLTQDIIGVGQQQKKKGKKKNHMKAIWHANSTFAHHHFTVGCALIFRFPTAVQHTHLQTRSHRVKQTFSLTVAFSTFSHFSHLPALTHAILCWQVAVVVLSCYMFCFDDYILQVFFIDRKLQVFAFIYILAVLKIQIESSIYQITLHYINYKKKYFYML